MIFANKCDLSHHSDKHCEFAKMQNEETHCMLILEWYPDDTRVENLTHCMVRMASRDRLRWRNKMIKIKKNVVI